MSDKEVNDKPYQNEKSENNNGESQNKKVDEPKDVLESSSSEEEDPARSCIPSTSFAGLHSYEEDEPTSSEYMQQAPDFSRIIMLNAKEYKRYRLQEYRRHVFNRQYLKYVLGKIDLKNQKDSTSSEKVEDPFDSLPRRRQVARRSRGNWFRYSSQRINNSCLNSIYKLFYDRPEQFNPVEEEENVESDEEDDEDTSKDPEI